MSVNLLWVVTKGGGGGGVLNIFLWRHSSAWKRRESYVNQAVGKNDVNQSFVFVKISHSYLLLHV